MQLTQAQSDAVNCGKVAINCANRGDHARAMDAMRKAEDHAIQDGAPWLLNQLQQAKDVIARTLSATRT